MQTTISVIALILYFAFNLVTAKMWSAKDMKRDFIDGQCFVGKVLANIFYAPAWFLKGIKYIVVTFIK